MGVGNFPVGTKFHIKYFTGDAETVFGPGSVIQGCKNHTYRHV